ncbi:MULTISPECIES: Flp pilus assembly protein CpaB [unclassified Burkholderia]|uniref:Flp pilus assembly protein CpaB n=1 Tax=unclassified Burkholderia TaxID=2613784 RepID=UPI000752F1FE|nr:MULTISPECIES: Flp pilus assembly protein CpaB [unclassified Burkholderia]KVN17577.1 Flp pilus assembly protein CpaB [Burkholderia sp. MSMB1552]KWZ55684.1 Flp pilus assembly protein CpaB [Burkholderia sp. MSMB1588]
MANHLTKIIAVLLIGIAILLGLYAWLLGRKPAPVAPAAAPAAATAMVPVVVAARALPAGQPIPADALKVQQTPTPIAGAFPNPTLVTGRIPASDIVAQAPVLESELMSGLADQIAPGERAVAIKVDDTNAVGNRLRPGNFVDVFVNLKREGGFGATGAEIAQTQARLLLSRVRVLSFGDATADRDGTPGPTGAGARTAVLAVPTAQVDALTLAEASGRLVLALRSPRDEDVAAQTVAIRAPGGAGASNQAAAGLVLSALSGGGASAQTARAAPAPARVTAAAAPRAGGGIEVIRGGRAETVAY